MTNKAERRKQKHEQRIKRLMARLTVLNHQIPKTPFQRKIWQQQRETILRQLRRHGIDEEQ